MPRVKRGILHAKKRRTVLSRTKGMMWGRKSKLRLARMAAIKSGVYAYRDRRNKKRDFRRLWQVRINAAVRPFELSYSAFMHLLKSKNIGLDRKILSTLAAEQPQIFKKVVESVK